MCSGGVDPGKRGQESRIRKKESGIPHDPAPNSRFVCSLEIMLDSRVKLHPPFGCCYSNHAALGSEWVGNRDQSRPKVVILFPKTMAVINLGLESSQQSQLPRFFDGFDPFLDP